MFYSTGINCTDVAEKLRSTDNKKVCVEQLCDECYKFEFHLELTFNSAEDCNISYETYTARYPRSWKKFFNILFPYRTKCDFPHRTKCDTIFQIIHYVIHNRKKHNPFHVGLAELFHDIRVKLVIEIFNKIGSCLSYDEL